MATTTIIKNFDESYVYAKRTAALTNPYTAYGDFYHLRFTSGTAVKVIAGTETNDVAPADVVYVIALSPVRTNTTINLNDTDSVAFSAGDPAGTMKNATITATKDLNITSLATGVGNAGDEFLVVRDPDVDNADPILLYLQSKSETEAHPAERLYFEKGVYKGKKRGVRNELPKLSLVQHYQAFDRGLMDYKGHRFNLLAERIDNREGSSPSEQEYFFNCQFVAGQPNESTGSDSDTNVSFDLQYTWKGLM